jgi:hypothetical protein
MRCIAEQVTCLLYWFAWLCIIQTRYSEHSIDP